MTEGRSLRERIRASDLTIYDPIPIGHPDFWATSEVLEAMISERLEGESFGNMPIRTRSKAVKSLVCEALGYPVPSAFKRTRPRFPGQNLDVYAQESTNLQVWNEELDPSRRYAIVLLSSNCVVTGVRVFAGERLAEFDTTGTLTQKYQARMPEGTDSALLTGEDTARLSRLLMVRERPDGFLSAPDSYPNERTLLSIEELYRCLSPLVGRNIQHLGMRQERNRGSEVHRLVCEALGYPTYRDHGQFPDVRHQLLEVKLQTSPTVDLGLVLPSSDAPLDAPLLAGEAIRHCDVRYAVFRGEIDGESVRLDQFLLTTGEGFFDHFAQFGGQEINRKLQIPLPRALWSTEPEGGEDELV